ncbi:hypothetical protein [Roseibium sp. RKSG952]|uniref:hypothetical protein n=1 Tax=Roseibium sp. RKSG952 TaxID=2529384 RepID=UPI0012BD237E|nr:hypothetical protein [Roseibium sp. RKSG952]MTH97277.1 hypothetical protein [Roseibium sp. RKSG952]
MKISRLGTRAKSAIIGGLILAQVTVVPTMAFAQQMPKPPEPAQMATQLGLDQQQTTDFVKIMDQHQAEVKAVLSEHGIDPQKAPPTREQMQAVQPQLKQLQEKTKAQLATVLTPEQMQSLASQQPPRS